MIRRGYNRGLKFCLIGSHYKKELVKAKGSIPNAYGGGRAEYITLMCRECAKRHCYEVIENAKPRPASEEGK